MPKLESILDVSISEGRRSYKLSMPDHGRENLEARLYLPTTEGPYPGVLFNSGLHINPIREVAFFAKYLTNAGFAVLIPQYRGHCIDGIDPEDPDRAVAAFQYLQGLDEVDSSRVGMLGFSYGAYFSLLGAADPRISKDVRYVVSVFGLSDLAEMFIHAQTTPRPTSALRKVLNSSFMESLLEEVRAEREKGESNVLEGLYKDTFLFTEMLGTKEESRLRELLDEVSPHMKEKIHRLSPVNHAENLHARVLLIHGKGDATIPFEQAEMMYDALLEHGRNAEFIDIGGLGHGLPCGHILEQFKFFRRLKKEGRAIIEYIHNFMKE